jgi:hypothetical protein
MRKHSAFYATLAAVTLVGLSTACSDGPTASRSISPTGAPARTSGVSTVVGDTTFTTFTVDPTSTDTYVQSGLFKLKLTSNSICDPAISTYGADQWDQPCTTTTKTMTITSKAWKSSTGHINVQFSPDLRFSPNAVNTLWLWKSDATTDTQKILWCPTGSTTCVDEAASDPSVATTLLSSGFLTRRIKHFSGYTVGWGLDGGSGFGM